ncbi:MAG TPA: SMC-Scp complex subunit ScpB [Anaerolineaceae bacterium]|nr:MAG: SMC-Scp complex subunit ScpB [Chloroflexi bacterium GWB2_54_36]HAL17279.1 SMC-Scp complex subunit ScpB [Anaerolineaceae bacterium]HBA91814.1 SMC-Scp complex subunit ScpB [Anaerolineaceae bacterium]
MTDSEPYRQSLSLDARIEAILFVAPAPVSIQQLTEALATPPGEIEEALRQLDRAFQNARGIRLQRHEGRYQLTTAPELAEEVEKFLGLEATARLSRAALETLAIIAYRQPITRPGVDAIRGVNSDGVIKSLLSKGLIQENGRTEGPGRPILYGSTQDFLSHFGINSLDDLPPFELLEQEGVSQDEEQRLLKD